MATVMYVMLHNPQYTQACQLSLRPRFFLPPLAPLAAAACALASCRFRCFSSTKYRLRTEASVRPGMYCATKVHFVGRDASPVKHQKDTFAS
jgi:hypothetical protein